MSDDSGVSDRSSERMVTDEPWIETKEGGFFFVNALLLFLITHLSFFVYSVLLWRS